MPNYFFILSFVFLSLQLHSQTEAMFVSRKDTIYEREIESKGELKKSIIYSTTIQLGQIPASFSHLKMNFEYQGKDTTQIVRTFTSDPHFINAYPKEPLVAGVKHPIDIRFHCRARRGPFHKPMGFKLANGDQIYFIFKGEIVDDTVQAKPSIVVKPTPAPVIKRKSLAENNIQNEQKEYGFFMSKDKEHFFWNNFINTYEYQDLCFKVKNDTHDTLIIRSIHLLGYRYEFRISGSLGGHKIEATKDYTYNTIKWYPDSSLNINIGESPYLFSSKHVFPAIVKIFYLHGMEYKSKIIETNNTQQRPARFYGVPFNTNFRVYANYKGAKPTDFSFIYWDGPNEVQVKAKTDSLQRSYFNVPLELKDTLQFKIVSDTYGVALKKRLIRDVLDYVAYSIVDPIPLNASFQYMGDFKVPMHLKKDHYLVETRFAYKSLAQKKDTIAAFLAQHNIQVISFNEDYQIYVPTKEKAHALEKALSTQAWFWCLSPMLDADAHGYSRPHWLQGATLRLYAPLTEEQIKNLMREFPFLEWRSGYARDYDGDYTIYIKHSSHPSYNNALEQLWHKKEVHLVYFTYGYPVLSEIKYTVPDYNIKWQTEIKK